MNKITRFLLFVSLMACLCVPTIVPSRSFAIEPYADIGVGAAYTSNVYQSRSQEADLILEPSLAAGAVFGEYWSFGYDGSLEAYLFHDDLLFHQHGLFILANPLFGEAEEHEFAAELGVRTQQNRETYAAVNRLSPYALMEVTLEPLAWLRWTFSENASYRWFYDATASDAVESWSRTSVTFTAQTRTTVSPRAALGVRYYPHPEMFDSNKQHDLQLEAGLHISQGIWTGAGLQWDYAYHHAFGESVMVLNNVTAESFNYIGEEFLFTGHAALMGFKQVFDVGLSFGLDVRFIHKEYGGWDALDSQGTPRATSANTPVNRTDQLLEPKIWVTHVVWPREDAPPSVPSVEFGLDYAYLQQWSNDFWFDTYRHLARFTVQVSW